MGVPKFYRWISERYPKINQVVTDAALLPEFDHLYLDMNGIIHGCTHPSHMDLSDSLSERDMMFGIMHYLDRIITQIVKPKVSVYMAIDGVAPRAKLNQQRSRRFRSAKDMAEATKDRNHKDSTTASNTTQGIFDSNCITPGTEFMARISELIQYFIRKKLKQDPSWSQLQIVFSGHEIPGEGEHKIMQHLREMRASPKYQPNQRHCMYGQDADLIMLGLVSHEPHFTLLREVVQFGMPQTNKNTLKTVLKFTKESDFQLLHLSVLREYLEHEFVSQQEKEAQGSYNLECIIDDFVFVTFLVGNDFLPHMPSLDIGDGAFDLLFDTYKQQRNHDWNGEYLTHAGQIVNMGRLEAFIKVIGAQETTILTQRLENEEAYRKKKRRWDKRDGISGATPTEQELAEQEEALQGNFNAVLARIGTQPTVEGWTPVTAAGQVDFKGRYYYEKLQLTPMDIEQHLALRKSYIEGLLWCLAYYYRGCISWGWFYPYHYGPMLSDLIHLEDMAQQIHFELGQPLKPFEQLMGCLPPASSALVPAPYRKLMTAPDSPLHPFYPTDFVVDMNGKKNPWEGVNLLPFIDVVLLKSTIQTSCPDSTLTAAERKRNSLGQVLLYTHDLTRMETVPSPNRDIGLLDIPKCHSRVVAIDMEQQPHNSTEISFQPTLVEGTQIPYPGFPSLHVIPIQKVELQKVGLNCFGTPSKYINMILSLHDMPDNLPSACQIADNVLGRSLFINWPMMHEGKVVAVTDSTCEVRFSKKKTKKTKEKIVKQFTKIEADRWNAESELMVQQYLQGSGVPGSGGLHIGNIQIRLKLIPLQGMKTSPQDGSTSKVWGMEEADVPLQLALWKAPAPDPRFIERGPQTLQDRFAVGANLVLTMGKYRGCLATVVGIVDHNTKVGVKVEVVPPEPPFGLAIARSVQESYVSSVDAAKVLQLHPQVFSKITGTVNVDPGRYDLGLNLKYGGTTNLCLLGYTRRSKKKESSSNSKGKKNSTSSTNVWNTRDSLLVVGSSSSNTGPQEQDANKDERIQWEFTPKAIKLVAAYRQKFPQVFTALTKYPNERSYDAKTMFGSSKGGTEMLAKVREWLNNVETAKLPRIPTSTEAMPVAAIKAVERASNVRVAAAQQPKSSLIKVPPAAIYLEGSTGATDVVSAADHNDGKGPELGDRIANLCANGIPFGARGTVVSIHDPSTGCVEVVMDEEFIGGSTLQGTCSNFRGKLCVWAHLLKISASDSKGVVDQMIPVGSGKAMVDKILDDNNNNNKSKRKSSLGSQPRHVQSSWDAHVDELADEEENAGRVETPVRRNAGESTGRTPSAGRTPSTGRTHARTPSRTASAGRGRRQGAWKEAKGPAEKGIGFNGRGGKSGFTRWKAHVHSNKKQAKKKQGQTVSASNTADLKAMLGVTTGGGDLAPNTGAAQDSNTRTDAAAGLKAMLGVQPTTPTAPSASSLPDPFPSPPPPPAPPSTAADQLMQLMMNNPQQPPLPPQQQAQQAPPRSAFNFTYVEEGKSEPPPQQQQQPQYYMGMPPTPTMPYDMAGGFMAMPPQAHAAAQPLAADQYPPLGGGTQKKSMEKAAPAKTTDSGKKSGPIVPAVVASKTKH